MAKENKTFGKKALALMTAAGLIVGGVVAGFSFDDSKDVNALNLQVGELQAHRLKRGNVGGKYHPRNIKMVCSNCHKSYHHGEF